MKRRLNNFIPFGMSLIPFGMKRQSWHHKYFNGHGTNLGVSMVGAVLAGMGIGAGLMYMLDPDQGRKRRTTARDKVASTVSRTGQAIGTKSRDIKNRARGILSETGSTFKNTDNEKERQLRQ